MYLFQKEVMRMTEPVTLLSKQTIEAMHQQPFIPLHTIDTESGSPTSSVISRTVRDAIFYGARLSTTPECEKKYDKCAADKLDAQMFAALKKA